MAGQYTTLAEIKQAVLYRADLEGFTDRHPTLNLNQEINMSWREVRTRLANNDILPILTSTSLLTLPVVEAVAGLGYAEVPWPAAAVSVHGLDVKVGGTWCSVPQGNFAQRRMGPFRNVRGDYQFADDGQAMWIVKNLPFNSAIPGSIMLLPVPSGGQYVVWYLDQWVDIIVETSEFPGQEGWIQYLIWDVAVKLLIRDVGANNEAQLQYCTTERDRAWTTIKTNVQKVASDGPVEVQSRYGSRRGGYRMIP